MKIEAYHESWPLKDAFSISRGSKTIVDVLVVEISDGDIVGRGESVPYPRYDQNIEQSIDTVNEISQSFGDDLNRFALLSHFDASAARNAVDCALWDFEAKHSRKPVWQLAELPPPTCILGVYTLSLEPPEQLATAAKKANQYPLLKIKLGPQLAVESVTAVREARPDARLIIDANEAWDANYFTDILPQLAKLGVEAIEQPLAAGKDDALEEIESPISICADESFHSEKEFDKLQTRYDIFNIKLDKTGGLTAAIEVMNMICKVGKQFMIGSMMATSLGLAPALLLAHNAIYVDLDSPVWLLKDREGGIRFENGILNPVNRTFWG